METTLTIYEVTTEDMGEYTIFAQNELGSDECSAELTVILEAPTFTQPLSDTPVTLNQTATLECKVTGIPKPDTTWFVSGVEVKESKKYHIVRKDDTVTLQVNDVRKKDTEKTYTCKATNLAGEATTTANLIPQGLLLLSMVMLVHQGLQLYACSCMLNLLLVFQHGLVKLTGPCTNLVTFHHTDVHTDSMSPGYLYS